MNKPPLGTQLDWSNPLNDGLVLHLACNEGHGDVVRDLSLYGNHGTLHNMNPPLSGVSGWNPGQTGIGLMFDGNNDYVRIPHGDSVDITGRFTVSVCMYIKTFPVIGTIIYKQSGPDLKEGFNFDVRNDGKVHFFIPDGANWNEINATISSGEWHYVAAVYDKIKSYIYIDGMEAASGNYTHNIVSNAGAVCVGGRCAAPAHSFSGPFCNSIMYDRAWTPKEVKDYAINPWQVYLDEDN